MTAAANILHADLDSFYASVERRDNPGFGDQPVIVAGGVVLAATYDAKALGVKTAMSAAQARQLCPQAAFVAPRMDAYSAASKEVFAVFEQTSPTVEALSIDEAFLDVGGMEHIFGSPREIGQQLRRDVLEQVGLPITVGIARTKFLAKVASAFAKPDGLLLVPPEAEIEFLHPLEIERLWGVGRVTSQKLRAAGVNTVGDIARASEYRLGSIVGTTSAKRLHALANNQDPRPVAARGRRHSIGAQHALGRKTRTPAELDAMLVALVDRVASRLRKSNRSARTVMLSLRFGDFSRATRSHTLTKATVQTPRLLHTARELLAAALPQIERGGITLIGVSLDNLEDSEVQMELSPQAEEDGQIDTVVDAVRDRYGVGAIKRGVLIGADEGTTVPVLPD
ncbi:MAG: DNA polymerase IV [Thermoleophilaceae bacterium]|nr:DNA polymerase IV [Thermoleophilaceae bacterium]